MSIEPRLDILGAALADSSRARILCELMDGRAHTNKELSLAANISPQTASAHLAKLQSVGFTESLRSGRCTYHRISSERVAEALETLACLSPTTHLNRRDHICVDTRRARSCYNHIAGRLGIMIKDRLLANGVLDLQLDAIATGPNYESFLRDIGLADRGIHPAIRPAKLCLDWTERRHHISGPLATSIIKKSFDRDWLARRTGSRALTITDDGYSAFSRFFGLDRHEIDGDEV